GSPEHAGPANSPLWMKTPIQSGQKSTDGSGTRPESITHRSEEEEVDSQWMFPDFDSNLVVERSGAWSSLAVEPVGCAFVWEPVDEEPLVGPDESPPPSEEQAASRIVPMQNAASQARA